jgi:hypothetical protein
MNKQSLKLISYATIIPLLLGLFGGFLYNHLSGLDVEVTINQSGGDGPGLLGASIFHVYQGGTGSSSYNSNALLTGNGASPIQHELNLTFDGSLLDITGNASVSGLFEVTGDLKFSGDLMPDGADCSNNQILKKTGDDDWDCAADATGTAASDSLNFDEFQNPLVLDVSISVTSGSWTWNWNSTSLANIGTASFQDNKFVDFGTAGVRISNDGDGAITFLGLGDGSDENFTLNLDDTANTGVFSSTTGLNKLDFGAIGIELDQDVNITLGSFTIDNDGTTFVFSDDANFDGTTSSSFDGSLTVAKGIFGNTYNNGGLSECTGSGKVLRWVSGLFSCGTLADADIPDTITLSGGTIGSNNISGTLTTTGTLTIGDNGDIINIDSSTWDVTSGVFSGVAGMTGTGDWDLGGAELEISNGTGFTFDTLGEIFYDTTDHQIQIASASANTPRVIPTMQKIWSATIASTSNEFFNGGNLPLPAHRDKFNISEIHCGISGGTSVVINIAERNGNSNTESVTCIPAGASDTSIDTNSLFNFSINSGSLEFGAITGTLDNIDYLFFSVWGLIMPE